MAARPQEGWKATYGPHADSARQARVALDKALREADLPAAVIADALLVLTELVANAIRHARTEFTLSAHIEGGTLRIEVFDLDTRPPALLGLDAESTSGRGLHIVSGTATDWGWNTRESEDGVSGKVVWAELAVPSPDQ